MNNQTKLRIVNFVKRVIGYEEPGYNPLYMRRSKVLRPTLTEADAKELIALEIGKELLSMKAIKFWKTDMVRVSNVHRGKTVRLDAELIYLMPKKQSND